MGDKGEESPQVPQTTTAEDCNAYYPAQDKAELRKTIQVLGDLPLGLLQLFDEFSLHDLLLGKSFP